MKVLFTYNYGKEAMEKVSDLGYDVDYFDEKNIDEYRDFSEVEILICYNPFKKIDLRKFTKLKLILLSSIGIDQLPKEVVEQMNITVCNNKGGYSIPMGEWIVMKTLELSKNTKKHYENQRNRKWHIDTRAQEIFEKKILFFGTGTISQEAVKRLAGFEMNIVGLNTDGRHIEGFTSCSQIKHAKEHVETSDIIVLALPSTKYTKKIFNKELINSMNKNSVLINIARGDILDEEYLIQALKNKSIKAAALDVFLTEPLPKKHALWDLDNVVISSHNSWISEKRNERRFNAIFKNLLAYKNKESLNNLVNIRKGY